MPSRRGAPGIDHALGVQYRLRCPRWVRSLPASPCKPACCEVGPTLFAGDVLAMGPPQIAVCDHSRCRFATMYIRGRRRRLFGLSVADGLGPVVWTMFDWLSKVNNILILLSCQLLLQHARTSFLSHTLLLAYARTHTPLHVHPSHKHAHMIQCYCRYMVFFPPIPLLGSHCSIYLDYNYIYFLVTFFAITLYHFFHILH